MPPFSTNIVGSRLSIACAMTSFSESSASRPLAALALGSKSGSNTQSAVSPRVVRMYRIGTAIPIRWDDDAYPR